MFWGGRNDGGEWEVDSGDGEAGDWRIVVLIFVALVYLFYFLFGGILLWKGKRVI